MDLSDGEKVQLGPVLADESRSPQGTEWEHEIRKRATAEVSAQSSEAETRAELLLLPQNICFHLERLHSAEVPLPFPSGPGPPTHSHTQTELLKVLLFSLRSSCTSSCCCCSSALLLLPPPRWNFELFLENTLCACEREHLKDPPRLSPQPITEQ